MRILLVILLITGCACNAQRFNEKALRPHIQYLASDELQGRGTGSNGEKKAAAYIAKQFQNAGLKAFDNAYLKPFTFRYSKNPHDTISFTTGTSANVVGFLDNKARYTIVVGAHYDHLGLGHDHNSLDANPVGKIHNGADDNASGTAGVIELARYFAGNGKKEPYNFLFICFSGEELGLLGSKKYCEKPDVDLKEINYMINMDMIGRLNDSTKRLIVYGVGTSSRFVPLLDSLRTGLSLKKDSSGIGPSDQTSFYLKEVPVLHFFTGQHADYHKPSDDVDKLNFKGEVQVLETIATFIESSFRYQKFDFQKTRSPEAAKTTFKVTMGVMPDYAFEGKGMRIDGVSENRPAAKAGLLKGDIVIRLGPHAVSDVMSYMKALSQYSKGDKAAVVVRRGEEEKTFEIEF